MEVDIIITGDCLEIMREMEDNSVDLVLTDPPYGINMAANPFRQKHQKSDWDEAVPVPEVFDEIFRVSQNQIIWGGNYFDLPPCRGFLYWDKINHHDNRCDGEMAWTSLDMCSRQIRYMWDGNRYGYPDKRINGVGEPSIRVHPTQKPIELMLWCLGFVSGTVLDPYCGSGTTLIAAKMLGRHYIGIDISEKYCEIARKRIEAAEKGITVKELEKGQRVLF